MSKGRKKSYINKLTNKDVNMLKAFTRIGYMDVNMLKNKLSLSEKRIINFQRDGYIEKTSYLNQNTKNAESVYRLTDKGKSLCTDMLGINSFYRSTSPRHDLGFAYKYFLVKEDLRESWINESQWRERFENYLDKLYTQNFESWAKLNDMWHKGLISPPDGGFKDENGIETAIEIITDSYGRTEILAKEIFVKTLNIEYEKFRI